MIRPFHRRAPLRAACTALAKYQSTTGDKRAYEITHMGPCQRHPSSKPRVFRLTAPDRSRVLKLDPRDIPHKRLCREYARLTELAPVFEGHSHAGLIEPVYLAPDGQFMVSNFVEGETADALVRTAANGDRIAEISRAGGLWLSVLHNSQPAVSSAYDPGWVIRQLYKITDAAGSAGPAINVLRRAELMYQLAQRLEIVRRADCPRVPSHGDFNCGNLILSEDRVTGLDIAADPQKLAIYDIVDFLVELDLAASEEALWDGDGRPTGPVLAGFLDGYGTRIALEVIEAALVSRLTIQAFKINRGQYRWQRHRRQRLKRMMARLNRIFPE